MLNPRRPHSGLLGKGCRLPCNRLSPNGKQANYSTEANQAHCGSDHIQSFGNRSQPYGLPDPLR